MINMLYSEQLLDSFGNHLDLDATVHIPSPRLTRAEKDPSFCVEVHCVDGVLPFSSCFLSGTNPPGWHPEGPCNPSQLK